MAISLVLGYTIQTRSWINWFPSSGVVVLVGIVIGTIVKLLDGTIANEYEQAIKFDSEFFSLVFLPIIIFQSGYSLKKHPFFSQLGSILLFATVGTIVSTFAIGGILFHLGQADITTRMSMEESLSFGALISAVDPVSTLAQFGSIKVPLSLGALVYGESVINDAVSIVLYRTFTSFMTEEVSTGAIFLAALAVVGVLAGSVLIGFVLACLAGFTLRILNLDAIRGVHTEVAETGILVVYSYAAFTMTEAAHLSGIVASLSCGISMNHYLKKVLSKKGLALSVSTFMVMADIAETIVFLQVCGHARVAFSCVCLTRCRPHVPGWLERATVCRRLQLLPRRVHPVAVPGSTPHQRLPAVLCAQPGPQGAHSRGPPSHLMAIRLARGHRLRPGSAVPVTPGGGSHQHHGAGGRVHHPCARWLNTARYSPLECTFEGVLVYACVSLCARGLGLS